MIHPLQPTDEWSLINNHSKIPSNKLFKTKEMVFLSHPFPNQLEMLKHSAENKVQLLAPILVTVEPHPSFNRTSTHQASSSSIQDPQSIMAPSIQLSITHSLIK